MLNNLFDMKRISIFRRLVIYVLIISGAAMSFTSCSEDYIRDHGNGKPAVIDYVRVCDPAKADSAIYEAQMLSIIAIVGSNLQSVKTILFGETEAALNTSLVCSHAIIVTIPFSLKPSYNMRLITADYKITDYPFHAFIPAPALNGMLCEYVADGETAVIKGNYFYTPVTVTMADGTEVEVVDCSTTEIHFKVPTGASEGPITVTTSYGTTTSDFHFRDTRGLITDFRTLEWGNSYKKGAVSDVDGVDGNYLLLEAPAAGAWVWNNALSGCYWAKDGRGIEPIAEGLSDTLALKFEANIIQWSDIPMIIWFKKSNEEFSVDDNNAQHHWKPWLMEDGSITNATTNGWRTVLIPLSLFNTNKEETSSERILGDMSQYTDFNLMIFGAQTDATKKYPIEIRIDNPRIVPYHTH